MTTIINTPPSKTDSGGGYGGLIIGIVVAAILVFLFVVYGLPAMRGANQNSGTTVNVPKTIDVNVNK